MRVVVDTNTIVSGILWQGSPRRVLDAARTGAIQMYTTAVLLAELEDVLQRPKFVQRLTLVGVTARTLVFGYAALARLVEPVAIAPVIAVDPDDDAVVACAVAARADLIVSGDGHLLNLKVYEGISIVTAAEMLARITSEESSA